MTRQKEMVKRDIIWLSRQRDKTGWGMMEGWTKCNKRCKAIYELQKNENYGGKRKG